MPCALPLGPVNMDVTTSVQSWSDGASNAGWALIDPDNNNGTQYRTSEDGDFVDRPLLTVSFVPTVFYSVGTNSADLKTGSPQISITGSTATLDVSQTGDVGVGDVIDFDSPPKLVYISSVISPSEFTVKRADGSTPAPAAGQGSR